MGMMGIGFEIGIQDKKHIFYSHVYKMTVTQSAPVRIIYSETRELKVDFESNRTQSNQFDFVTASRTKLFRIFKLLYCFFLKSSIRFNRTEPIK
jgi:hypothetical protein